jgi:hypothetical protein
VLGFVAMVDAAALRRLVAAQPTAFFDEDHYRGDPAVLAPLANVAEDELATPPP